VSTTSAGEPLSARHRITDAGLALLKRFIRFSGTNVFVLKLLAP